MTAQTRTTLKTYFETGDKPTQAEFTNLIDSCYNPTDDGTVETSAHAVATYETKTSANLYLKSTVAATTYETKTSAASTYETKASAATTYETKASASYALSKTYDSGPQTIALGTIFTAAHGLGSLPKAVDVVLRCVSADATTGYSLNDELDPASYIYTQAGAGTYGYVCVRTTANISVYISPQALVIPTKSSAFTATSLDSDDKLSNFKLIVRAQA